MINGHIDGLQVLKGGQGKATVYFSKDAMHGALDLNEMDVTISKDNGELAQILPVQDVILSGIEDRLERMLQEIRDMREPETVVTIPACDGCEKQSELIEKAEAAIEEVT